MSSAPWTFGTMMTSSRSPISVTRVTRSSSPHGLSRELTRVQSWVGPTVPPRPGLALAMSTRPWRDLSLFSAFTASSRLPRRTSTVPTMSGTFAAILSLPGSKKWMARLGRAGISRGGAGAPTASGAKKSLAGRVMRANYRRAPGPGYDACLAAAQGRATKQALAGSGDGAGAAQGRRGAPQWRRAVLTSNQGVEQPRGRRRAPVGLVAARRLDGALHVRLAQLGRRRPRHRVVGPDRGADGPRGGLLRRVGAT